MENTLISVILPIYNGEKYIERLLNKLRKLKNEKIQIICINDGSTDNTINILNKYNNIFKVINLKTNHGVSYARNTGIKYATGKYVVFIDSDDMIYDNYFKIILENIKTDKDIYAFNICYKYKSGIKTIDNPFNGFYKKKELFNHYFLIPQVISWVTNKVIKKSILNDRIRFNNKLKIAEDLDFMLKLLQNINNIYFINETLYIYNRTNINSSTMKNVLLLPYSTYMNNKKIYRFLSKNGINKEYYIEYKNGLYKYVKNKIIELVHDDILCQKLLNENRRINKDDEDIKFSIIIPTYNVEKYIDKTIKSVLVQNYDNYEIIIVDDGSTDKTVDIINSVIDNRIKLIKQKNKGVSSARNNGIKNACGEYIVFLDGDDYLEDYALEYIYNRIKDNKKNTTFIGQFNTVFEKGCNRNCKCEDLDANLINNKNKADVMDYIYRKRIIFAVWRFVVRRDLIIKNNLYFKEQIIHEDEEWVPRLFAASNNFSLLERKFYNYRIRKKSIMTTKRKDLYRQKCLIKVAECLIDYADKSNNITNKKVFLRNAYKNLFQAYLQTREISYPIEPDVSEKNRIKKNIIIYGSSRSGKTTLANVIKDNLRYSVISLDNIVSGFEKGLPQLNINHNDRSGTSVSNLNSFLNSYIKSLNGINQKTRMFYYTIEGSYFSEELLKKYKDDFVIIVLINNYKSKEEFFKKIRAYDTVSDWTHNLSDKELLSYCENLYESEKNIKEMCKKLNIKYYVTGNNRIEVIDELVKNMKEMVHYD